MGDLKEIRAGDNPLEFRQTQPIFIQVWLHVSIYKDHHQANITKNFLNKVHYSEITFVTCDPIWLTRVVTMQSL